MELPIPCDCGKQLIATEGMAGSSLPCDCGRVHLVPSLREMRNRCAPSVPVDVDIRLREPTSAEQLRKLPLAIIYGLLLAWMGVTSFGSLYGGFYYGGPIGGLGALLMAAGQIWLVTQIYTGNPVAAVIVALIPCVGLLLAIRFISDYWQIAKWPVLCYLIGLLLYLGGVAIGVSGH